jgi:hypothetical protein
MTGSLRRSLITSKPRSHPATDGPASSGGDGGAGAVGWALLYRGLSRGLSQDARSRRRWAHPGCLLPTSGGGWQPGTALEQSPQHPKAGSGPAYGQRPDDGDESSRRPRLGFHAALVVPVRGVPGVGCGAFAVHWRPGWLPTSPARGVRGRAAAGRAAGRHAHPRRAAARRDAAGWACHLVGARPAALAARTLRPARAHRAHPSPGSVCGPDGPIPPARSAHDGPSGRLRLVGSPPSRWPGHPTRAGRAWRLDRSARATYGNRYGLADRLIPVTPHRRRYASLAAQPAATPVTVATEPPLGRRCLAPDPRPSRGHSGHGNGGET